VTFFFHQKIEEFKMSFVLKKSVIKHYFLPKRQRIWVKFLVTILFAVIGYVGKYFGSNMPVYVLFIGA
jgi:hypothetical protein